MSINLSQSSAAARAQQRKDKAFTRSVWIAIFVLFVTAGTYSALRIYNGTLQGKISAVDNKIDLLDAEISSAKTVEVANAIFRLEDIDRYYTANSTVIDILETISSALVDIVIVDTYEYVVTEDDISVTLDMTTTDILAIARQIESFKQVNVFHTVSVSDVDRDAQTGEVHFTVLLQYNIGNKK